MNVFEILALPEFERLRDWVSIGPVQKAVLLDFIAEITYADGEAFATGFDEGYAEAKSIYEREDFHE
jgi:hypothetical protein